MDATAWSSLAMGAAEGAQRHGLLICENEIWEAPTTQGDEILCETPCGWCHQDLTAMQGRTAGKQAEEQRRLRVLGAVKILYGNVNKQHLRRHARDGVLVRRFRV